MAYINIKMLQIEEHRAWMLRAWCHASCIITLRIIMIIGAQIISAVGNYYDAHPCEQIVNIVSGSQDQTLALYPGCAPYFSGANSQQFVPVEADFGGNTAQLTVAMGLHFGSAGWLALALHAIGIELYLKLTPAESERLRNVSYQRQLEAGMENPGRAGFTVDRFGDTEEWLPTAPKTQSLDGVST